MSVLVGDVLIRARNAFKDPCATLFAPTGTPPLAGAIATGGSLQGTVYAVITWLTPWGETTPSAEVSIALSGGQNAISDNGSLIPPPGAIAGRIYYGPTAGGENQYAPISVGGITTVSATGTGARPPNRNRAYLPDTDGLINAQLIYKWLNGALVNLGVQTGGVLDENGVAIASGSTEFTLPGWWFHLTDMWHDGWVVMPERAVFTWMKSPVNGVPGIVSNWKNAASQVLGLWPQPSLGVTSTTLTAPMGLTDSIASVANSSLFRAPGMAMCENEVFSYSSIGGTVYSNPPVSNGSQFVTAGTTTVVVFFGQMPSNSLAVQVGANWATNVTTTIISTTQFQATFSTPAPVGGSLMTWSVTVIPSGGHYTSLGNIVRGLGGTTPASHAAGAVVNYLVFRFRGYRCPTQYTVGQSALMMDLPPAWDEPLSKYMLARFREYEQDDDDAQKLDMQFKADCKDFDGMQADPTGPRQLGWVAPFIGDSQNLEELVGTILIP